MKNKPKNEVWALVEEYRSSPQVDKTPDMVRVTLHMTKREWMSIRKLIEEDRAR